MNIIDLSDDELAAELLQARVLYSEGKKTKFSDAEFDAAEEALRIMDPNNEYFER